MNIVMTESEYKLHRKEIQQKYREKNRDKIRNRSQLWSRKNRRNLSEKQKINREKNRISKGIVKYQKPLTINSPFVKVYNSIKNSPKRDCFITIDDIRVQFEYQNGLCALSGLPLLIPKSSGEQKIKYPTNISVDRIDSSLPYQIGNIQLVCLALNYAKNDWNNSLILDFVNQLRSSIIKG